MHELPDPDHPYALAPDATAAPQTMICATRDPISEIAVQHHDDEVVPGVERRWNVRDVEGGVYPATLRRAVFPNVGVCDFRRF